MNSDHNYALAKDKRLIIRALSKYNLVIHDDSQMFDILVRQDDEIPIVEYTFLEGYPKNPFAIALGKEIIGKCFSEAGYTVISTEYFI